MAVDEPVARGQVVPVIAATQVGVRHPEMPNGVLARLIVAHALIRGEMNDPGGRLGIFVLVCEGESSGGGRIRKFLGRAVPEILFFKKSRHELPRNHTCDEEY